MDVLCAALALCAAPTAQSRPTWPALRAQLRSSDPAQAAWAAYHVAEGQLREAGPDLALALRRADTRDPSDADLQLALALLDAVVRSGAKVPAEALMPWAQVPECAPALLAYAARDPAAMAPAVRAILDTHPDELTWIAACNLLLSSDPRSLMPWLASQASVRVEIDVRTAPALSEGHSMSISYQKPDRPVGRDGFPPVPRYEVVPSGLPAHLTGDPEQHVPVDGPTPVTIVRRSQEKQKLGEFLYGLTVGRVPRVDYAVRCLDRMVPRRDGGAALASQVRWSHPWRDQDTWQAQVVAPALALRNRWHEVVDWLTARRMLDPSQSATLRAAFHIEVSDQRADRTRPLPEIK